MNDNRLFGPSSFSLFPPAVKKLLIINVIFYLATLVFANRIDLVNMLGLHYPASPYFRWYQFITYMFMHGSFMHLFSNMFALWMFGICRKCMGNKEIFNFYFITGLGASLFQLGVNYIEFTNIQKAITLYSQTLNQQDFIAILDKYFANIYDPNKVNEFK